jgi:chromosomal replication initiation ATPase DnaA
MKSIVTGKRVGTSQKDRRDVLLYLLWKTGRFSNKEIGSHFGLSYSAVSQRAKIVNLKISKEKELQDQYDVLNSLIKV